MKATTGAVLAATLILYCGLAYGYITLTPIWQNPDEPAHFNYIAFVARTGTLPELRDGDWDSALLERLKTGTLQPGDSVSSIRYESWQPPLFYVLAAPIYLLGSPDDAVQRLRAFNAVIGAITLVVAYRVAREALPQSLASAASLTMVGIPMFVAVSAAVSADPLANLLATVVLLLLVRGSASGWLGLGLGLGLITKLALAIFVPLALIVIRARSARPWRDSAIAFGVAAVVVAPWLVHQVTTYGWADLLALNRHAAVVADQERFPGLSADYLGQFLTISFHSFWAQFGWMAIVAPDRLYIVWGALSLLALVGLIVGRRGLARPVWLLMIGTVGVALAAYVAYNFAFVQFQGRYLFTAIVPLAMLLVAGWSALAPPRVRLPAVFACALTLVALNAYALLRVLVPGFAPAT